MKTYNVTKEDILKLHSCVNKEDAKELENRFPDAFEVELIVGEWYKTQRFKGNFLIQIVDKNHWRGFDCGKWESLIWYEGLLNDKEFVKATDQEVEISLIEEAKKRGFKKGVLIVDIYNEQTERDFVSISSNFFEWEVVPCGNKQNEMALRDSDGNIIFHNGVWATLITTMTKQEAEEKLNCKII